MTAGIVDDAAVTAFTLGQCHALALALWEATGWPVLWAGAADCMDERGCDQSGGQVCACQIDHVVVGPPGGFVDITGRRRRLDYEIVEEVGPALFHTVYRSNKWFRPNLALARTFVEPLLAAPTRHLRAA